MKFAFAVGVLSQTIPVRTEDLGTREATLKLLRKEALSTHGDAVHSNGFDYPQVTLEESQSFPFDLPKKFRRAFDLPKKSRRDILKSTMSKVLPARNPPNSKLQATGGQQDCDPQADVGLLACDKGYYCKHSSGSKLGGKCVEGSPMPCFPGEGVLGKGIDLCERDEICQQDTNSKLGGFCKSFKDISEETMLFTTAQRRLQLSACDPTSEDFRGDGTGLDDVTCDCSTLDLASGDGSFSCTTENIPLWSTFEGCESIIGTFSYQSDIENGEPTLARTCYNIASPETESTCLSIDYSTVPNTCRIEINGITCNSCSLLDGDNYAVDCSNVEPDIMGQANSYTINQLIIPQFGACYCDLQCEDLSAPDPYIQLVVEDQTITCGQLLTTVYEFGDEFNISCADVDSVVKTFCCANEPQPSTMDPEPSTVEQIVPESSPVEEAVPEEPTASPASPSAAPIDSNSPNANDDSSKFKPVGGDLMDADISNPASAPHSVVVLPPNPTAQTSSATVRLSFTAFLVLTAASVATLTMFY